MPSPAASASPGGLVPAPQVPGSGAGHGVPRRRRRPRLALGFASPLGAGRVREGGGRCSTLGGVSATALVPPPPPLPLPRATVWRSLHPGTDSRCSESRGPGFPRHPLWRTCRRDVGSWSPWPPLPARVPPAWGPPLLQSGLGIRALIAAAPSKCPGGPAPAAGNQAKKERKKGVGERGGRKELCRERGASRHPLVGGICSCPPAQGAALAVRSPPHCQLPTPDRHPVTPDRRPVTPECQGFPRRLDCSEAGRRPLKAPLFLRVTGNSSRAPRILLGG